MRARTRARSRFPCHCVELLEWHRSVFVPAAQELQESLGLPALGQARSTRYGNPNSPGPVNTGMLEEVLKEINLSNSVEFDASTQQKIGKLLGAETVLFGSYFELLGTFRIDARIVKTQTGEIFKSEGVNGKTEDFVQLEKELVWKIVSGLDVKFSEKEKSSIMSSKSISYKSTLLYAEGLEYYDNGNIKSALAKFQESLSLSPEFDKAKSMIAKISSM